TITHWRKRLSIAIGNGSRLHELVGHVQVVRVANYSKRIGGCRSVAEHRSGVPLFRARPATVAIHAEVAASHARNEGVRRELVQQPGHVSQRRARHGVTAVEHEMQRHTRHADAVSELEQCAKVPVVGGYAALTE